MSLFNDDDSSSSSSSSSSSLPLFKDDGEEEFFCPIVNTPRNDKKEKVGDYDYIQQKAEEEELSPPPAPRKSKKNKKKNKQENLKRKREKLEQELDVIEAKCAKLTSKLSHIYELEDKLNEEEEEEEEISVLVHFNNNDDPLVLLKKPEDTLASVLSDLTKKLQVVDRKTLYLKGVVDEYPRHGFDTDSKKRTIASFATADQGNFENLVTFECYTPFSYLG